MSLAMSKAEREAFLVETHVAILSVAARGRGPLTLPVWYRYEPGGDVYIVTAAAAQKVACVRREGRASLCVQTETPPYRYVSVEGPAAVVGEPDMERDVREVACRYLGAEMGAMYLALTKEDHAPGRASLLRLHPARWLTADFRRMGRA